MIEVLGCIGATLFGCACVPMAWKCVRDGDTGDIPTSSMWLFLFACITFFGYLVIDFGFHYPLFIGVIETICWLIVLRYRYWPRLDFTSYCIRDDHHHGPCNGLPRSTCPNLSDPLDDEFTGECFEGFI
jgi:uncharacterized protein with PQ loop repeat